MKRQNTMAGDLLFLVQVVCAFVFGGGQFLQMLATTEGVSVTWYLFWLASFGINLALTVRAYRVKPSRVVWQTCATYALWIALCVADIGAMFWSGNGRWTGVDTASTCAIAVLISFVAILVYGSKLSFADPMIRGFMSVIFIGIPQGILAWTVWTYGTEGIKWTTLAVGYVTLCIRLGQLAIAIREASWDKSRIGAAMGDTANLLTWIAVTVAWCMRK